MAEANVLQRNGRFRAGGRLTAPLAFIVAAISLAVLLTSAVAELSFPELTGRVVDQAGLLTASQRAALESDLAAFEATSTDQIVVVTTPSLQGYPIDEFGYQLGRKWGIGQKNKDNGILVIVAPNDRKVRIEVGRRLEPLLPDGRAGSIISNTILPMFRRGDFPGGIKAGVAEIKAVLTNDKTELAERSKRPPPPVDYSGYIVLAIWLLIVIMVIRAEMHAASRMPQTIGPDGKKRRRSFSNSGPIIFPGGSGGWSGGFGGGGGGSSGGFSGGGGDFGGGGASG
ncbi:MAG: TPM domain-containing protein, partial [Hyphomicrobiaceae bacterium]